jgi:hypothetical protein
MALACLSIVVLAVEKQSCGHHKATASIQTQQPRDTPD